MPNYPGFSERFRISCMEYGIKVTQRAVGNFFGVSEITARNWLTGEKLPGMRNLIKIAEKTDVTVEWLATNRGPMRPGKTDNLPGRPPRLTEREKVLIRQYRQVDEADRNRIDLILAALAYVSEQEKKPKKKE